MSSANTFDSLKSNYKESYSDSKKKDRFKRTKSLFKSKKKATAELEASKDPLKWLDSHQEMSIKGLKGIAI